MVTRIVILDPTRPSPPPPLADLLADLVAQVPPLDLAAAAAALRDLPALWADATPEQRRRLLGRVIAQIYARRGEIYAVRPQPDTAALLAAVWESRPVTSMSRDMRRRSVSLLAA